jgi:hypothetical protein
VKLDICFGSDKNYSFDLSLDVPGLDPKDKELDIPSWPSSDQVTLGKAIVTVRLPSGEEYNMAPSLKGIEVGEIYTRDKSLLEGLDL